MDPDILLPQKTINEPFYPQTHTHYEYYPVDLHYLDIDRFDLGGGQNFRFCVNYYYCCTPT